jgi:hypothetical protein
VVVVAQTHMQCQRCPVNGRPVELSALQTARTLIREEGPLRLFRGVSTMLGASLPAHAVYFSVFEAAKKLLGADGAEHTPIASGALSCGDMLAALGRLLTLVFSLVQAPRGWSPRCATTPS